MCDFAKIFRRQYKSYFTGSDDKEVKISLWGKLHSFWNSIYNIINKLSVKAYLKQIQGIEIQQTKDSTQSVHLF